MAASENLIKAIAATAELCGKVYSTPAAAILADDLSDYPEDLVLRALNRVRRELSGRSFSVAEIIARIDDGRPGVEEAWSLMPMFETQSVVWTEEMAAAWGVAAPLLDAGDKIAARMAFKEAYTKYVTLAKDARKPVTWTVSVGTSKGELESVLQTAVDRHRISAEYARALAPVIRVSSGVQKLLDQVVIKRIGGKP